MKLADSMRSKDNSNKVGHGKKKIKEDGEEYNYLWIEWQIFPITDMINKLPENKNGSI